jgi:hypothetical protein
MHKQLLTMMLMVAGGLLLISGCSALGGSDEPRVRTELVTVEIIITATPDPDSTPLVQIITATPDRTRVAIPDDIVPDDNGAPSDNTDTTAQTGSQSAGNPSTAAEATAEPGADLPQGCLIHTIEEGEAPFLIADEYGADPFLLLQVNNLDEESSLRLRPGDTLIVPLDDCPVEQLPNFITSTPPPATDAPDATEEATEEATPEATEDLTPTVTPTVTLAPTAVDEDIDVQIVSVLNPGDVTAEGVRIRNNGSVIDVTGWTVSDIEGNEYTFPDQRIFGESELTLYTRTGQDTAVVRFWGEDESIWQPGDVVTLRDNDGRVQASYRIEQPIDLD